MHHLAGPFSYTFLHTHAYSFGMQRRKKVNNPPDHYMIVGQEKASSAKSLRVQERPRSFVFYLRFKFRTKI
ncbi:MAG: hypothetical protein WAT37_10725 [Saprospiraceae bacterium]